LTLPGGPPAEPLACRGSTPAGRAASRGAVAAEVGRAVTEHQLNMTSFRCAELPLACFRRPRFHPVVVIHSTTLDTSGRGAYRGWHRIRLRASPEVTVAPACRLCTIPSGTLTAGDHTGFRNQHSRFLPPAASLPGPGSPGPLAGTAGPLHDRADGRQAGRHEIKRSIYTARAARAVHGSPRDQTT
jgi:hypothetical protein